MEIKEVLAQFDLKNKENDVYLACLELGVTSVNKIARKAGIKRTTVYDVLESLMKKELIGQTQKGKKRLFYAEEPEKLHKLLEEKQRNLAEIMPILKSIYNTAGAKPKIRYHEGLDGIKSVFADTLNFKGEVLAFTTGNIIDYLGRDFDETHMEKKKKAKIFTRNIGPETEEIINFRKIDKKFYKKTKIIPKEKYPFSIEINIYGNRVAFMSYREEMGIIIESNEIANNMSYIFELAWQTAK